MSITEITAINENFPLAGVDQPSQGYRDNFANIKVALTDLDSQVINVLDDISDVDTTSVAPITNDMLLFDGANWVPQAFETINDLTPQLGGMLDTNGFTLGDGTNTILGFVEATTPVNWITVGNADTGVSTFIEATGSDTDVNLTLTAKNDGSVIINSTGTNATISTAGLPLLIKPSNNTVTLRGGSNSSGNGYDTFIRGGDSTGGNGNGGSVSIRPGLINGAGSNGAIRLRDQNNNNIALFIQSNLGVADNYAIFYNSPSGQTPGIISEGSTDIDVDFAIRTKGNGKIVLTDISYPNTDGTTSGDVMKTDAAGTLSFAAPSDLGEFTIALLPDPTLNANSYALATDASGGRTVVRSDGTAWKIVAVEGATVA